MLRREFLRNSATALAGSLMGLGCVQAVFAGEHTVRRTEEPPRMALIIDDIGYSRSRTRQFLALQVPITFAVLPQLRYSRELAVEIHENRHEIMLHQPMEPYNSFLNPGPGALFVGTNPVKIAAVIEKNINDIPYASGINNHMGSRFTSSAPDIYSALTAIKTSGLFFVDSVTSGRSLAYRTARQLEITAACRNIFLDNRPTATAVYAQLLKLKAHAVGFGGAVGIGHPFSATIEGIRRFISDPTNSDVSLVHVSQVFT